MGDGIDYKNIIGDDTLFATCKVNGRVPTDEPNCVRNPSRELTYSGQGYCVNYRGTNGTRHCDHRFKDKKGE